MGHEKQRGTFHGSTKGFLINNLHVRRSLPQDQRDREKECPKKLLLLSKKEFALCFPKQRNKADPKEYSIKVHIIF